jgi:signal transduction histidine kinase
MVLTSLNKKDQPETKKSEGASPQRLQELERLAGFGEVLGGVAHEINNPLQIILGKAQILLMRISKDQTSSKSIEDLKAIERGAQRISELINCLNDLSRQKPEEKDLTADIDLHYLIGSILTLIKASLKDKKIELSLSLPEGLPKIKGNPSRLKELFLYLTLNAKQRIDWEGKLELSFKKEEGSLRVEFSDQGGELPREVQRFLKDPAAAQVQDRLCFGISNSSQILKEHKGDLEFRSSPGKGNTVAFKLPLV